MTDNLIIGKILRPQGIKGELKVSLFHPTQLLSGDKVIILNQEYTVREATDRQGYLYLTLDGMDIAKANTFRGKSLELAREVAGKRKKDNEVFADDIIGKTVVVSGSAVGILTDIQNFGAKDVFYVEDANGKEILFAGVDGIIESVGEEIVLNAALFKQVAVYED